MTGPLTAAHSAYTAVGSLLAAAPPPADDGWSPPGWLTAVGSVVALLLGSSAVAAAFGAIRSGAATRRKEYTAAARALTAWAEYPYRIRRRTSDDPEALAALAARGHDLQEQLADREAWCAAEHPLLGGVYAHLRTQLASNINNGIETAWYTAPVTTAAGMHLGDSFPVDTRSRQMLAVFNACVQERFGWRRLQPAPLLRRRLTGHVSGAGFGDL